MRKKLWNWRASYGLTPHVRESRLLAPMVYPSDNAAPAQWLGEIQTPEEADVLCHRLLRHYPETVDEALRLAESEEPRCFGMRPCALC